MAQTQNGSTDADYPTPEVTTNLDALREEWTPKQHENWENHGSEVYEAIGDLNEYESGPEIARAWYLATYRPKMRGDGMMKRDHVEFGTTEHYIDKEIDDTFNPMGSFRGVIMAGFSVDTDTMKPVVDDIIKAKVSLLSEPQQRRLINQTKRVASLYGAL